MALDNEDIKQLIAILQRGLSDDKVSSTEEIEEKIENKPKKSKKNTKHRIRQQKIDKFQNKFLEMPEHTMHKEDSRIDRLLCKQPPVSRHRTYEPVTVACRVCSRKEQINPSLITEGAARYKCNKCSTSEG